MKIGIETKEALENLVFTNRSSAGSLATTGTNLSGGRFSRASLILPSRRSFEPWDLKNSGKSPIEL
jgi:hypothetical protein